MEQVVSPVMVQFMMVDIGTIVGDVLASVNKNITCLFFVFLLKTHFNFYSCLTCILNFALHFVVLLC